MNPQGASGMRGIGHAIVCVRDLDEARATCARPGLALTPRGGHSLGSSDHLAMFGALAVGAAEAHGVALVFG